MQSGKRTPKKNRQSNVWRGESQEKRLQGEGNHWTREKSFMKEDKGITTLVWGNQLSKNGSEVVDEKGHDCERERREALSGHGGCQTNQSSKKVAVKTK